MKNLKKFDKVGCIPRSIFLTKMKKHLKRLGVIPEYTEVSLFAIGLTFLLLVINNFGYFKGFVIEFIKDLFQKLKLCLCGNL